MTIRGVALGGFWYLVGLSWWILSYTSVRPLVSFTMSSCARLGLMREELHVFSNAVYVSSCMSMWFCACSSLVFVVSMSHLPFVSVLFVLSILLMLGCFMISARMDDICCTVVLYMGKVAKFCKYSLCVRRAFLYAFCPDS